MQRTNHKGGKSAREKQHQGERSSREAGVASISAGQAEARAREGGPRGRGKGKEEGWLNKLEAEQTKTSLIFPERERSADLGRRDTRSTDAPMGGTQDGKAHLSTHIRAHNGIWSLPLFSEYSG